MTAKRCCRSCKQFVSSKDKELSLCRLRKIKIHSEIATFALCHHWMRKDSNLDVIKEKYVDKQLDFAKVLVVTNN